MQEIIDGSTLELRNVKAWRRKLGILDSGETRTITTIVNGRSETTTVSLVSDEQLSPRLRAFAQLEEAGYVVQTNASPPTFAGRAIQGTTNQVSVVNGTGINANTRIALPQDIHTGASPLFWGLQLASLTTNRVVVSDGVNNLVSSTVTTAELEVLSGVGALTGIVQATAGALSAQLGTANYLPKWSATLPYLTTTSLVYDTGTLVGVGTITPATELTVASTSASDPHGIMSAQYSTDAVGARFHFRKARGTEAAPTIIVTADVLGRVRFSGYDGANYIQSGSIDVGSSGTIAATRVPTYMAFSIGTDIAPSVLTEVMRLVYFSNTHPRVGIGIAAPIRQLHLDSGAISDVAIQFTNNTTGHALTDGFYVGSNGPAYLWNYENTAMGFATNNLERMTILATGFVGIGVTAPATRLHVDIVDAVATVTDVLRLNHSLAGGTAANFGTGLSFTGKSSLTDKRDMARIQSIWTDATDATRTSSLQFQTVSLAAAIATKMTILGDGKVGIGVNPPSTILHVTYTDSVAFALTTASGVIVENLQASAPATITLRPANSAGVTGSVAKIGALSTGGAGIFDGAIVFGTRTAGVLSTVMALSPTGGLSVGDATATTAIGVINAVTGYRVASAAATVGTVLGGNGTNFVPVTATSALGSFTDDGIVYYDGATSAFKNRASATQYIEYSNELWLTVRRDIDGEVTMLDLHNLDATASASAGVMILGTLSTTAPANVIAGVVAFGKEQIWTSTASTQDGFVRLDTALNGAATAALSLRSSGSVVCGKDSTSLSRTDDFLYACPVAGVPTGVPTTFGSRVAIAPDSTNRAISYYAGAWYQHSRRSIVSSATQLGNTALTETDLFTTSIAAGTGTIDGCSLDFVSSGTFATSLSTDKRIRCYWATVLIFDSGNLNITVTSDWTLYANIMRVDATNFKATVTLNTSSASLSAYADYSTGASTWANANTLKITGQGTNASDVVGEFWKVGYEM